MIVRELIEELQAVDPELPVYVYSPYGQEYMEASGTTLYRIGDGPSDWAVYVD